MEIKRWERYLLRELLLFFSLILGSFYLLHAAIDYSLHMQDFVQDDTLQLGTLATYYFYVCIKRADLLVPLSLLVATLHVATTLTLRHELLALQAGGIPLKKIFRPFLLVALALTLFNYAQLQWMAPRALSFLDAFQKAHFHKDALPPPSAGGAAAQGAPDGAPTAEAAGRKLAQEVGKVHKEPFHVLQLHDGSRIVYQSYDEETRRFFDLTWIRSMDELWKMAYLDMRNTPSEGLAVDHIQRSPSGLMERTESFERLAFPLFSDPQILLSYRPIPHENRSISALYQLYAHTPSLPSAQRPALLTHLLFKITTPWLALLAVVAALPFSVAFRRDFPLFLLYALAIFALLAFYVLLDASITLGTHRALSPVQAILFPFFAVSAILFWNYAKTIRYG